LADEWTLGTRTIQHPSVEHILFEASNLHCDGNESLEIVRRWHMSSIQQSIFRVIARFSA